MSIRTDLRQGRDLGLPFCCRWRWALAYAINPDGEQAVKRGICFNADGIEYIPCRVFHKATVTHREHERLINLRAFAWQS
jgi:hypothetical protein